jgi:hypothetical protein
MKRFSIIIFVLVTLVVFILELTGNSRVSVRKQKAETEADSVIVLSHEESSNTSIPSLKHISR